MSVSRRSVWVVSAVLVALLTAGVVSAQPIGLSAEKPSANVLPAGTLVMLDLPDLGATATRAHDNMLYKVLNDPLVKEYLKPLTDKLGEWQQMMDFQLQANTKLSFDDINKLLNGRVTLALTDWNLLGRPPRINAVVLLTPKDTEHLKNCVARFLEMIPPNVKQEMRTRQAFGVEISEVGPKQGPVTAWAMAGNTFVFGFGQNAVDDVLRRMEQGGASLSTNETYATLRDRVRDYSKDWLFYASFAKPVQLLKALGGQAATKVADSLGLEQVKGMAVAGRLEGPAVDDILYLYFAPGAQEGALRSLLSPNPVNTDLLACVPPDAEQVVLTRLNLPLAYDTVIQVVKDVDPQAHEELRQAMDKANQTLQLALEDDFFHALGDELVSYSLPLPIGELTTQLRARGMAGLTAWLLSVGRSSRSAVMLTVKDAARITKSMRTLTDLMAEGLKPQMADVAWEEQTHAGVQARVLRGVPQIGPAYAVTGRFLIIGGSLETLKSAVDQINTPGRSIRDSAMWAAVEARVPKGAGFISVGSATAGVEQLHLMFREFWLRPMVEHMQQIGQPDKLIAGVLQNDPAVFRDALKRNAFFSVTTIKAEPDGVAIRGHTLLGAGSVAVGAGPVLGGMLLPALIRSRGEARSASCANNLRQIGMAIAAYEMNHNGELPNTLEELVPLYIDDARVFQCPSAKDRPLAPGEKFRIDYDYLGHLPPGVAKPNTIIAYDKPGNHAGRRNCLYYDGHVGRVLEADLPRELQESLDGLKPWLDKQPEDVQKRVKAFCGAAD